MAITEISGYYLINVDSWFIAPDGVNYKAVWGKVQVLTDDMLGIKTNRNSTNWFLMVGDEDTHVIIAGCQVHYATKCDNPPPPQLRITDWTIDDGKYVEYEKPNPIYYASKLP